MRALEIGALAGKSVLNERPRLPVHMIFIILMDPTVMAQRTKKVLAIDHFLHEAVAPKNIDLHDLYFAPFWTGNKEGRIPVDIIICYT